jgi:hypothetical protein
MNFSMKITPAIPPEDRHKLEDTLVKLGYAVSGGGQTVNTIDPEESDITFSRKYYRQDLSD